MIGRIGDEQKSREDFSFVKGALLLVCSYIPFISSALPLHSSLHSFSTSRFIHPLLILSSNLNYHNQFQIPKCPLPEVDQGMYHCKMSKLKHVKVYGRRAGHEKNSQITLRERWLQRSEAIMRKREEEGSSRQLLRSSAISLFIVCFFIFGVLHFHAAFTQPPAALSCTLKLNHQRCLQLLTQILFLALKPLKWQPKTSSRWSKKLRKSKLPSFP